MKSRSVSWWLSTFGLLAAFGCSRPAPVASPHARWIDLSHDLSAETVYWPTSDPFKLETVAAGMTEKGYYYSAYKFCAAEHGGTHMDAPAHFAEGRKPVDQVPLDRLISAAVTIDVSTGALSDRDYQVGVEDLTRWEAENGRIPDGAIVLLHTGYGRCWPDRMRYMGTDKRGAEAVVELHFPGLSPEAARWLTQNRRPSAIGLDTPSIDYGQSEYFESHRVLAEKEIPVFENVANLDQLPPTGVQVVALPLKIRGGSGGPLRIVASLPSAG